MAITVVVVVAITTAAAEHKQNSAAQWWLSKAKKGSEAMASGLFFGEKRKKCQETKKKIAKYGKMRYTVEDNFRKRRKNVTKKIGVVTHDKVSKHRS